jgi:hypothetical protein
LHGRAPEVLAVFTLKDLADIREIGGIGWLRVSAARAGACSHAILYHNARDPRRPGTAALHRRPVLVGLVRGTYDHPEDGRVAVLLSKVARAEGPPMDRAPRATALYRGPELLASLELGPWEPVAPVGRDAAIAARAAGDDCDRPRR